MSTNVLQSLPAPVGGVSQSPPELRASHQLADAVNTYPDPQSGLGVRRGTQVVAGSLGGALPAGTQEFEWSPGAGERYLITVSTAGVKVVNLVTGANVPVSATGSSGFYATGRFTFAIVGDRVYVASRGYSRAQWTGSRSPQPTNAALVSVLRGAPSALYKISLGGVAVSVRTPDDPPPATKRPSIGLVVNSADNGVSISASPAGFTAVDAGTTVVSTLTVTRLGSFTGSVTLDGDTPANTDVTIDNIVNVDALTITARVTIVVHSDAPSGFITVPIVANGAGGITDSTNITLGVVAIPGGGGTTGGGTSGGSFNVHTDLPVSVDRGASNTVGVSIARLGGYASDITLVASGAPSGMTVTFSPNPVSGTGSTATVAVAGTVSAGQYSITVTGNGPSAPSSFSTLTVNVMEPAGTPSFSLSAPNVTLPSNAGQSIAVTATRSGGFSGPISLALAAIPAGLDVFFDDGVIYSGETVEWMSVNTVLSCPPGTYTVFFTGSAAGVPDVNVSITVTVT